MLLLSRVQYAAGVCSRRKIVSRRRRGSREPRVKNQNTAAVIGGRGGGAGQREKEEGVNLLGYFLL